MELSSIKVNAVTYALEEKTSQELENNFGRTVGLNQKIFISSDLAPDAKAVTLIHELLHVISMEFLGPAIDLREEQAVGITAGLIALYGSHNIDFQKLIDEGLEISSDEKEKQK